MKLTSVAALLQALNREDVRYLVAGGLAVNAHGYIRFTNDADLAIELASENIERAFRALATLGYQPRVPISAAQFADPTLRESWVRDQGMNVLPFWSDAHKETPVDIFATEPFDFGSEYEKAIFDVVETPGRSPVSARYVTISTLIAMKEAVGRPRDLDDAQHLRWIQEEQSK